MPHFRLELDDHGWWILLQPPPPPPRRHWVFAMPSPADDVEVAGADAGHGSAHDPLHDSGILNAGDGPSLDGDAAGGTVEDSGGIGGGATATAAESCTAESCTDTTTAEGPPVAMPRVRFASNNTGPSLTSPALPCPPLPPATATAASEQESGPQQLPF